MVATSVYWENVVFLGWKKTIIMEKIDIKRLNDNVFDLIGKEWVLITSGNKKDGKSVGKAGRSTIFVERIF